MVKCAVKLCKNDSRKQSKQNSGITFHRFPKDPKLLKKWIDSVNISDWEPNIWSKVCSLHFAESNFYRTKSGLRKLVDDAIPSLLLAEDSSPEYISDSYEPYLSDSYESYISDSSEPSCSTEISNIEIRPLPNVDTVSHSETVTPREKELEKDLIRLNDIAKRRRKRCNALYAVRRRLLKKVDRLSQKLNELKRKRD